MLQNSCTGHRILCSGQTWPVGFQFDTPALNDDKLHYVDLLKQALEHRYLNDKP